MAKRLFTRTPHTIHAAMNKSFNTPCPFTAMVKSTMHAIIRLANVTTGKCGAYLYQIVQEAGVKERTANKCLAALKAAGLIIIKYGRRNSAMVITVPLLMNFIDNANDARCTND